MSHLAMECKKQVKMYKSKIWLLFLIAAFVQSCGNQDELSPKPYAFHRIDLPEVAYEAWQSDCPYTFEKPKAARVTIPTGANQLCWINLEYPEFQATVYLTYGQINGADDLGKYIAEAQRLTYKHTIKASSIEEVPINNPNNGVFGFYYKVGGNAASNSQFYLTDSSNHFVRGSMYFYATPRADSLAPVIAHVQTDLEQLLQSFRWK